MKSILTAVLLLWVSLPSFAQGGGLERPENYLAGRPDSPVRIEIFSDFECPACRAFYLDTIRPLMAAYAGTNKLGIVLHEFPLPMHVSARPAARFALASKRLGKEHWAKVTEHLYSTQAEWSYDGNIERVLSRLLSSADMAKLKEIAKDPEIDQAIDREVALGNSKEVRSTPTFFVTINGKEQRVVGGLSFALLRDYIERSSR